jgi:TRAP-type mannitol/chloroaromatic compound transport system permease small subunit
MIIRLQLSHTAARLDRVVLAASRVFAWLVLAVVAALFLQWPVRQLIGAGHLALNDAGQVLHAAVFLTGIAYGIVVGGHVRLEVFHAHFSPRGAAWVTLGGHLLFVLPWLAILGWYGYDYVKLSIGQLEAFPDTYTPGYFVSRIVFGVFVVLATLASLAQVLRSAAVLFERRA